MEKKKCRKCGKELPAGSRKNICERCENKRVDILKIVGMAAIGLGSAAIRIASNGKVPTKKG